MGNLLSENKKWAMQLHREKLFNSGGGKGKGYKGKGGMPASAMAVPPAVSCPSSPAEELP